MTNTESMNLMQFFEDFETDRKCRVFLEALRWPDRVTCPTCQSDKISRIYERNQFDCDACGYQFSVTANTIFHDSHLPLTKWFVAVYLMCESRKGISANQLKRTIKVAYKTAWYLCHRIRKAMDEAKQTTLTGTVERDDTYIGGKRRHVDSGYLGNKTVVFGLLQRAGGIRLTHKAEEWVHDDSHTNGTEGVGSLFKRSIVRSYHQVSAKHLQAYLDEFEWRFNGRENPYFFRDTLMKLVNLPKMEYKELIEKSAHLDSHIG